MARRQGARRRAWGRLWTPLPTRDRVGLFEPHAELPVSHQPAVHDLFAVPRRQFLHPVRWSLAVAAVVAAFLPGRPFGLALPVVFFVIGVTGLVLAARRCLPAGKIEALDGAKPRRATVDDLRRSGRVVAAVGDGRVSGDGSDARRNSRAARRGRRPGRPRGAVGSPLWRSAG